MTSDSHEFISLMARWEDFKKKNKDASRDLSQPFIDEIVELANRIGIDAFNTLREDAKPFKFSTELIEQVCSCGCQVEGKHSEHAEPASELNFAEDPVNASMFLARLHKAEYDTPYAAAFGPMIEEGVTDGPIHIFINAIEHDRQFEQWILQSFPFDVSPRIKFYYGDYATEMTEVPHVVIARKSIQPSTELSAFNENTEFAEPSKAFRVQYTGSKAKMIDWILAKTPSDVKTVLDPMSGGQGTSFGYRLAGKTVYAGDVLYSSFCLAKAVIENNGSKLSDDEIGQLMAAQSIEGGFTDTIEQVYDTRQFMTKQLRRWIDGFLVKARELEGSKKYIALSALTKAIIQASSHTGNLSWGPTSARLSNSNLKEFQRVLQMALRYINGRVPSEDMPVGKAFHADAFKLTEQMRGKADLLYLDPPYITPETKKSLYRSYQVVSDVVEGKHRPFGDTWDHRTFEKYMRRLIELGTGYKYILFSYRDNPMFPRSKLKALLKEKFSTVVLYSLKVRYTSAPAGEQDKWREILILASNKSEVASADGQEMSFSGVQSTAEFSDMAGLNGIGLRNLLRDHQAFPIYIGHRVEGKDVKLSIRDGKTILFEDGAWRKFEIPDGIQAYITDMPDSIYSAVLNSKGEVWITDVIEMSGKSVNSLTFDERIDIIWNPVPANRTGPIYAVEYQRIDHPKDAIGPLVVASRGVDSRGAFIMSRKGIHEFKNTEGYFAKVLRVAFNGMFSNMILKTEIGYTKATEIPGEPFKVGDTVFTLVDNKNLFREDMTPWFSGDIAVLETPEEDVDAMFSSNTALFEDLHIDGDLNIESMMMPASIHRAITSFEMEQDSRFTRPAIDSRFKAEIFINGKATSLVITRKLGLDNSLVFSTEDELNLSREPRNHEDAVELVANELARPLMNRLASGRFTLKVEDCVNPNFTVPFDEGWYRMGAIDDRRVEIFYSGKFISGRFVERMDGSEWTMIHSQGTPFALEENGPIPPTDFSGLPKELEEQIPTDFHYWKLESRKNRTRARNSLIQAISMGIVNLVEESCKVTISEQKFGKPVRTSAGATSSYRHLVFHGIGHYFLFNDNSVSFISTDTTKILATSGEVKPNTQFNATKLGSTILQLVDEVDVVIHAWFDDWKVFTLKGGEMSGTWTMANGELVKTGKASLSAFSSMGLASFSNEETTIKEVPGSGDTPKYLEITTPLFAYGYLKDGKGQMNYYPREEVKKAVLAAIPGQEMAYVDLYHFQGERQRIGVIKEVWWNDEKEFDYKDPHGANHKGVGMSYCKFLVTSKWGVNQILKGKERFVSAEPMFDMIPNKEYPEWYIAMNIGYKGLAITADPMVREAVMQEACTGDICWNLN